MRHEAHCSHEQSIKFKTQGFDQGASNSLPTQEIASKWLREAKGIWINICISARGDRWEIYRSFSCDKIESDKMFATYEQALSDAIDSALRILETRN